MPPHPVQIRSARECPRSYLSDRSDHHDLPLRMGFGERSDQPIVQPLVDYTEKAQPRRRQALLGRVHRCDSRAFEVRSVHAAGKAMQIGVLA